MWEFTGGMGYANIPFITYGSNNSVSNTSSGTEVSVIHDGNSSRRNEVSPVDRLCRSLDVWKNDGQINMH